MSAGFYKKMDDGSWSYGTKVNGQGFTLTSDNKEEIKDGWVWYDEEPIDFSWEAPELTNEDIREQIIDILTEAAEVSGLGIPFESFYYEHRKTILKWVRVGGSGLEDVFNSTDNAWLDMREDDKTPSPREFALKLLAENDSFIN